MSIVNPNRLQRLSKEALWILLGQFLVAVGSLVGVRVLTEYLGPRAYGELGLALTIATLVTQVAMGGVSSGVSRFYSIATEKHDVQGYLRDSRQLMFSTIGGVAIVGGACLLWLLLSGNLQWFALASAALVFSIISGFNGTLSGVQNAARQRGVVAFHSALDTFLKVICAVLFVVLVGASGTSVLAGYLVSSVVIALSQVYFLKGILSNQRPNTQIRTPWKSKMWAYSWPIMLAGVFNWGPLCQ